MSEISERELSQMVESTFAGCTITVPVTERPGGKAWLEESQTVCGPCVGLRTFAVAVLCR